MPRIRRRLLAIAAAAGAIGLGTGASAQEGAAFFKDKTVTYIVATAAGGGYDTFGRLVCEFMQKNLPGSTFIVKNVPGAGHLIGTNTIYASKPDGLTMGTFNTGLLYNQLIGHSGVKFDLLKMSWIGKGTVEPRVFVSGVQSPIKSWADVVASKDQVTFATSGVGSSNYVEMTMLSRVLKLPVRMLSGYNGNEDQMAIRRGEVMLGQGSRSSWEPFEKNGFGRMIAQTGGKDKDVPQLSTLVKDERGKKVVALIESQSEIGRLTAGPPDIPTDRLKALQDAYRKALADPELRAKAEKLGSTIAPAVGDEVLKMIKIALDQPADTIAILKEAMATPEKK